LLVAAVLKVGQALVSPETDDPAGSWPSFILTVTALEAFLGMWMLAGIQPLAARIAALLLFSVFTGVSVAKGVGGADSCGCLGVFAVNPWGMAAVDGIVILLLLSTRPPRHILLTRIVGASIAAVTVVAIVAWIQSAASQSGNDGIIDLPGNIVVLTPESWIGKYCPILHRLGEASELSRGQWRAVLYHHDCERCRDVLARSEATTQQTLRSAERVALIEVPPFGGKHGFDPASGFAAHFRLSNSWHWVVVTPTELDLVDGVVTAVRDPLASYSKHEAVNRRRASSDFTAFVQTPFTTASTR